MVNIQDNDAKIDFRIDHFLLVTVKVVAEDGSDLKDTEDVSTANLFMYSLFSNCEVSIKSTQLLCQHLTLLHVQSIS